MPSLFVVGSFVVGLTMRVPRVPVPGETLVGEQFDLGPGGKGTNQAIAAARLGAEVGLLACIGDDLFAQMALDLYQREKISLQHIHRMAGINTAVGFVTLLPSGENWITVELGANLRMQPSHVDAAEAEIARTDLLLCQFETPLAATAHALSLGRKHGVRTLLNPAPAKAVNPEFLAHVDVLTPNETEARILLGLAPDYSIPVHDLANRLLKLGVQQVVVTQGKQGALIVTPEGFVEIPAVEVTPVDVTGAGDCFNASLAVALAQGQSLRAAVEQAIYSGAYAITKLGVIDGLPTYSQLDSFKQSLSKAK